MFVTDHYYIIEITIEKHCNLNTIRSVKLKDKSSSHQLAAISRP